MLSRVAENIYWLARYLERAENTARLINVNSNLLMDLPRNTTFGWAPLIAITGGEDIFEENYKTSDERSVTRFLISNRKNPSSILSALSGARENLRITREIMLRDAWEQLNELYHEVEEKTSGGINKSTRYDLLSDITRSIQQITGLLYGALSRDLAYDFYSLGQYIERADMTTRIIDVRSANLLTRLDEETRARLVPFENIQWVSVLKSLTAYQMYRQHKQPRVVGPVVLSFLLQDRDFPRSFYFCLLQLEEFLKHLPRNEPPLRTLARLERHIQNADVNTLTDEGLHEFIDDLQLGLSELHDDICQAWFNVQTEGPMEWPEEE
ncbi:MAG: alpha-E domain-containing protein [Pseudomonadota bacterium]